MGRPIGSRNKEKPFLDALKIALRARPGALRTMADKLIEGAEAGNLTAIKEVADRVDGKPTRDIEYHNRI
jgi:hypothetical protein